MVRVYLSSLSASWYSICGMLTKSAERQPTMESTNRWPYSTGDRTDLCTECQLSRKKEEGSYLLCGVMPVLRHRPPIGCFSK
jgi:hypothetical protein